MQKLIDIKYVDAATYILNEDNEFECLHELTTAQGWGDNYTIRTEANGLRAYKTPRK